MERASQRGIKETIKGGAPPCPPRLRLRDNLSISKVNTRVLSAFPFTSASETLASVHHLRENVDNVANIQYCITLLILRS